MVDHATERLDDKREHREERFYDTELSKANFIEVCNLIESKFNEYIARLKTEFTTKEEHKVITKVIWSVGLIAVVALALAMMALGMKLEDFLIKLVGAR